jgi:hypothetical protein
MWFWCSWVVGQAVKEPQKELIYFSLSCSFSKQNDYFFYNGIQRWII